MFALYSVGEKKYGVCQHIQGLESKRHHSAPALRKDRIHFNSFCVKLNEFGFSASLVMVPGNKTKEKGATVSGLNSKLLEPLKQTKQKRWLRFTGEMTYDGNFYRIILGLLPILPSQGCHVWLLPVFGRWLSRCLTSEGTARKDAGCS